MILTLFVDRFSGFPVATTDNAGTKLCYSYDLADRLTNVGYTVTFNGRRIFFSGKSFVYDTASGFSCGTSGNLAGRLAETYTQQGDPSVPPIATLSDEGYCYDADGRMTDTFTKYPGAGSIGSGKYTVHVNETWFPNGTPQTVSVPGIFTF